MTCLVHRFILVQILVTSVLFIFTLGKVESTCIKGKFILDEVNGPIYNSVCYSNGVVTLTDSIAEEVSWRVNGESGVSTIEKVPLATDTPTAPKGSKIWCITLWAPSSPSHTIYSSSIQSLTELKNSLSLSCNTQKTGLIGSLFQSNGDQNSFKQQADPESLAELLTQEMWIILSLPEVKKIERDMVIKLSKLYCPSVIRDFLL